MIGQQMYLVRLGGKRLNGRGSAEMRCRLVAWWNQLEQEGRVDISNVITSLHWDCDSDSDNDSDSDYLSLSQPSNLIIINNIVPCTTGYLLLLCTNPKLNIELPINTPRQCKYLCAWTRYLILSPNRDQIAPIS